MITSRQAAESLAKTLDLDNRDGAVDEIERAIEAARAEGRLDGWKEGMQEAAQAAIDYGSRYPAASPRHVANAIDSVMIAGPLFDDDAAKAEGEGTP